MTADLKDRTSDMRYAIYYLPLGETRLWKRASGWLGYDSITGTDLARETRDLPASLDQDRLIASPKVYGFHATLKAPFRLNQSFGEKDLLEEAAKFATATSAAGKLVLAPAFIGDFAALVPVGPQPRLHQLADACVLGFERFRAPMNEAERKRRILSPLTVRQIKNLEQWGYPYVFEEFRFHMTLTGDIPQPLKESVLQKIVHEFPAADCRLDIDTICVCRQAPGERFRLIKRFKLSRAHAC